MVVNRTATHYSAIDQSVEKATLNNGLEVVLLKKPGFQRKYITFSTHYGGMDSLFIRPGNSEPTSVPDGIAHFLEHKLFEEPDGGNVLDKYSRMGASPNAYTGQYYTVYLCSLVDQFDAGLDLLLDYVQRPHFTDENVKKEQGIIEQEIQMGRDNPQRMAYYALTESLFVDHPARIRVIGSAESIHRIDKQLLYMCHDTFYHPSNMILTVAGDVEFERVIDIVTADMKERNYEAREPIGRPFPDEPDHVNEAEVRQSMRVSRPYALMGFKGKLDRNEGESRSDYHKRLIAAQLALESVLGRTNRYFWDLYERGIISSRYGYNLINYPGAAYFYVGAETEDADAFVSEITANLAHAAVHGIDADQFETAKRRAIGELMSAFDMPEQLVGLYVVHHFDGLDLLERRALLDDVDIAQGNEFLAQFVQEDRRSVSIVEPL